MSDFYTVTGVPATGAALQSSPIRTELAAIETAMNKLPTITGKAGLLLHVNAGGTALESGTITSAQVLASVSDETGTGLLVFGTSPTLTTPILGTPTSGTLTNCTGLPAAGVTGTALVASAIGTTVQAYDADLTTWAGVTPGTGIATALAVAVGTAGSPVVNGGALGTPSSGTATNLSGTAASLTAGTVTTNANLTGHVTSVGNAAVLGSFTVAQLNTALSDGDIATGGGTATGTNTGDNATNTQYSGLVSNATHTGDATGATALTVVAINGTNMAGLATGILKNTTTTGVPSIAVAGDFPTLNQNTSGSAASCTGNAATVTTNANLTGHVTSVGNAAVLGSFTLAQLNTAVSDADVAVAGLATASGLTSTTAKLLGRATAGTGALEEITLGTNLSYTGTTLNAAAGGSATLTIDNKTAAYTVVVGDLGKVINCTANSFTVDATSAVTLGAGFNFWLWNTSDTITHEVVFNPPGAETIDGASQLILYRGMGIQIVCDGTNFATGADKVVRGYAENFPKTAARPIATGNISFAVGQSSQATGAGSCAVGYASVASGTYSFASGNGTLASAANSTAFGINSTTQGSQTATGSGAMALGGSYASGTDSFAAAIANNTSSYGATGPNSIAIGNLAKATTSGSIAIGKECVSTGDACSIAIGNGAQATANGAVAIGNIYSAGGPVASGVSSYAFGHNALAALFGKWAYASGRNSANGDAQSGVMVLRRSTTDATPTAITSDAAAASTTNQVILPNNSTYTFRAEVTAMRKAGDGAAYAGYVITGLITRVANAAATTLLASTTTVLFETTAGWDCVPTADTTNGGLAITVTGVAATNIRWVAVVTTAEVTYA